jgi:hypothetical protein
MTSEEWANFIEAAEASSSWDGNNREWLNSVLQTESAQRLFGVLLEKSRQLELAIVSADLTTENGRFAAIDAQGQRKGIAAALTQVQMLTETTEE